MKRIDWNLFSFLILSLLSICACRKAEHRSNGTNIIEEAELMAIYNRSGYDEVFIVNARGDEVAHYVLVDRDDTTHFDLPEGAVELRVPLQNVIVDSEIYASAFEELGASDVLSGIFDAQYVTSPSLASKVSRGTIKGLGPTSSPDAETIVKLNPDAILVSYFEGMQTQGLDKLGIPIIKMFDLQESSPLGRAEWLRFIGLLAGKEVSADSLFTLTRNKYADLKRQGGEGNTAESPKVLTELIYEGSWYVPGGKSYQAALIGDAGGNYFKKEDGRTASLNLTAEQVLGEGGDADVWLIRFFGDEEQLRAVLESDPIYGRVKAYKDGNIYFSNTAESGLFREFPFHPDLLLQDYRVIFSGDSTTTLRYFKRLESLEK